MSNPIVDQRLFAAGEAVVVLPPHLIFEITGPDRAAWLHAFLAQKILGLQAGDSVEALMLDANGHIQLAWRVVETADSTWMFAQPNAQYDECASPEAFEKWLRANVFRKKVSIANHSAEFAVVARNGHGVAIDNMAVVWHDTWVREHASSVRYSKTPLSSLARGFKVTESLVPVADAGHSAKVVAGLPVVAIEALTALRIAAHRPAQAFEVDAKSLPHELDWLSSGVHMSKGCYRGQETVAKVHNLGHPPRRLVLLQLDGSGHFLPNPGDAVFVAGDERQRGFVTSVANHFEMGPIALAVINRLTEPSAQLEVVSGSESIAAAQEIIVPTDAGAANPRPRKSLLNGHG